ncbi:MAG: rhodanese-like domain-containing protein [Saprospiraceae bacterium]|nr:rhodanese-like domain-containing protein [Saprospiraceae bacterium]
MKNLGFILAGIAMFVLVLKIYSQSKPVKMSELLIKNPGVVIDVRTIDEWNSGHYKNALHLDWLNGDLKKECANFDKSKTYYLYCAAGGRSGQATEYMKSLGFRNVVNLGGYSNLK